MAKLYFYYSTMNAGKTTVLLQSAHNYRERGLRPYLLTPALDDRAGRGTVRSRIGLEAEAFAFEADENLLATVEADLEARGPIACVLVDEAQFLSRDQVHQLGEVVDRLGIPVLAFGLRTDFRGELFTGSQYLLAWADELKELKTICHTGSKATMVVRVDDTGRAITDGAQVEIGGNDRYVPVSRAEFKRVFFGGERARMLETQRKEARD
ncbi:thymidine kinase [Wenzhouxiangella sp. XN79A]|uniref:thymidine kinase n=1 Tax=Wenzhouxiangella sp. XN79A TaxID=2724193 RepID=UPI00144A6559|nr:thymidine kinase [Wenzhouxiangella sp. XN79A]NKI36556.1 thymidine kinase [Wenzhouxiangella sp. XN79A]